jgi:SRSO17 transposase
MTIIAEARDIFNPERWGLPMEAIEELAGRLIDAWERYRDLFITTHTRDTSLHAFTYLRGLLTMDTRRNYANIGRRVVNCENDGQNLQNFMSDSPWSSLPVFEKIQRELTQYRQMAGGMLTLDDTGDKRSGSCSAGASRQYIGRLGKVDMGQVGVMLGYFQQNIWSMLDARLYLPEKWFTEDYRRLRQKCGISADCRFKTKTEMAVEMILDAQNTGIPFEVIGCDSYYGKSHAFRARLDANNITYMAGVRNSTKVYLEEPRVNFVPTRNGRQRMVVESRRPACAVGQLLEALQLVDVPVRQFERGILVAPCASRRVWTVAPNGTILEEWLLVRRESEEKYTFSLCNADAHTDLDKLAAWRCAKYFVERTIQDAKSEIGWDELQACKFRAWQHHAAMTALALWFISETKIQWAMQHPTDPDLADHFDLEMLPALSTANIREMLKAVLPLPALSPRQARKIVIRHLVLRARSIRCRCAQYAPQVLHRT